MLRNLSQISLLIFFLSLSFCMNAYANEKSHGKKNENHEGSKPKKKKGTKALDKRMSRAYGLLGFRLGLGSSSLSQGSEKGDQLIKDPNFGFGFHVGATIDKAISGNDFVGLRAELLLSMKSFNHLSPGDYKKANVDADKYLDSSTSLYYLELPVLVTLRFMKGKSVRPIGYFGGYGAALLSASGAQDGSSNANARVPFSTFDYGLIFGGGVNMYLGKGAGLLTLELRTSFGLANIADNDMFDNTFKDLGFSKEPIPSSVYHNRSITLIATYHL